MEIFKHLTLKERYHTYLTIKKNSNYSVSLTRKWQNTRSLSRWRGIVVLRAE